MRRHTFVVLSCLMALPVLARTRSVRTPYTPTFRRDVAPIFQQHCQQCHTAGGIAPFVLTEYQSAKEHTFQMKLAVVRRQMPPWLASPDCGHFANMNRLNDDEMSTIVRWIDGGAPEGKTEIVPVPRPDIGGWMLGQPDLVFAMPHTYVPPADHDVLRCFILPYDLPKDLYVQNFEFRSSARQCVHHGNLFVDPTGETRLFDGRDGQPGWNYFDYGLGTRPELISAWVPGGSTMQLPDGIAFRLAQHSQLFLLVHYSSEGGHDCEDRTEVGVYLAKSVVDKIARPMSVYVGSAEIRIPAGAKNVVVSATGVLQDDIDLRIISGHMHFLGHTLNVDVLRPGMNPECLLDIGDWDVHWSAAYSFASPVHLEAGSVLRVVGTYDNSEDNPHNPSFPPRDVFGGPTSLDEMCGADLIYTLANEHLGIQP